MTHAPHQRSLQALILDKKGDRSYERVSRDCGGIPTRNALQKLATNRTRAFPDRDTLLGLQRGLPAPMSELLSACAVSMKLFDDASAPGTLVLRGAGDLPASAQQLLVDLSHEMQRLAREGDGDVRDAAPITRAGESPAAEHDLLQTPELALVSDENQHPLDTPAEDELEQRRRERRVAEGGLPVDEELMAGYDAPQESILERDAQDADAEGSQLPPEEDA
ncbi:hypothetical protein [Kocuria rosea]|uniref:hypothetical protein n=1 Tax=Kocuria rosea TaxID=1275 RepID=UPI003D354967